MTYLPTGKTENMDMKNKQTKKNNKGKINGRAMLRHTCDENKRGMYVCQI